MMTENPTLPELHRLIADFEACTLSGEAFNHRAHLLVVGWYAQHVPTSTLLSLMRARLQALLAALGVETTPTTGYHESITRFWAALACAQMEEADCLAGGQPDLEALSALCAVGANKRLVLEHYSKDCIGGAEARARWVSPDQTPLPERMAWWAERLGEIRATATNASADSSS